MAQPQDEILSNFCALTGCPPEDAEKYLTAADWDLNTATAEYYQDAEDAAAGVAAATSEDADDGAPTVPNATSSSSGAATTAASDNYTGPRTLDGRPAPRSQLSSSAAARTQKQPQKQKGLMTLNSLRGSGGGGHGHDHDDDGDDDDDEDDDERGPRDLFAGGEKSGLAVQDPKVVAASNAKKVIRDIMSKKGRERDDTEAGPSEPPASRYRGTGQTLGGEGVPSRVIPGAGGPSSGSGSGAAAGQALQERALHIWQDGFSIDEGPLHRFDDPNNAADLQMIRNGRAPLHLMNVQFGQPVDVKLHQHNENWRQLPRVYRPFAGTGHRLGSPVPGAPAASAEPAAPAAATPAASAATAPAAAVPAIDESQPTVMIRVQLPDGTRLPARFNTTQTIGDVYAFAERALPQPTTRAWVLATTFPNKEHTDRSLVLGETPEFRRGGAAVVKWT